MVVEIKKRRKTPPGTLAQQIRGDTPAPTQQPQPIYTGKQPQSMAPQPVYTGQQPQSMAPQPQPQLERPAPSEFTGGEGRINADPRSEFSRSDLGTKIQDFVSGLLRDPTDPGARDIPTLSGAGQLGVGARAAGEVALNAAPIATIPNKAALFGRAITKFKALKNARVYAKVIKETEKVGSRIDAAGGLVSKGQSWGGKLVPNAKAANIINDIVISNAKKISPFHWKALLGVASGGITGLALTVSIWSGAELRNSYGDAQQTLGRIRDNLIDDKAYEEAEQILEIAEDHTAWYNELNDIFSNPVRASEAKAKFVMTTKAATDIKLQVAHDKDDEKQTINEFQESMSDGDIDLNSTQVDSFLEDFPDSYFAGTLREKRVQAKLFEKIDEKKQKKQDALDEKFRLINEEKDAKAAALDAKIKAAAEAKKLADEQELLFQQSIQNRGQKLVDRVVQNGVVVMTAEQIVNDSEISAFALDANNWATSIRTIYDQAQEAIARSAASGGLSGGYQSPPSTLGFGLLQSGSEFTEFTDSGDKETQAKGKADSLDDLAMQRFGVPYDQLTPLQKSVLNR